MFTLETDVYVWCYALLVVLVMNEEEVRQQGVVERVLSDDVGGTCCHG